MSGVLVTGTDTGVGKTLVSAGLLHSLCRLQLRAIGMKPVAAGATPAGQGWRNDDVDDLVAASNVAAPIDEINPYCFAPAIAPHLAAADESVRIDPDTIVARYASLSARADVVVVEGAGGFLVPLNERETFGDLAVQLALPVVLVVGMRLGCLNHALLSAEAIRSRGLRLAGWVANRILPEMPGYVGNRDTLATRLAAPLIAEIPYATVPDAAGIDFGTFPSTLRGAARP